MPMICSGIPDVGPSNSAPLPGAEGETVVTLYTGLTSTLGTLFNLCLLCHVTQGNDHLRFSR